MVTEQAQRGRTDTEERRKGRGPDGRLTIRDGVVEKIAGMAAREVEGVSMGTGGIMEAIQGATGGGDMRKGIKAEVGERQVAFDMGLVVDYGYNIPNVVSQVRERISQRVQEMTGLETVEINVEVADIHLPDERQESRVE
jgi:uncharacterized alkaline shock family protein YloU